MTLYGLKPISNSEQNAQLKVQYYNAVGSLSCVRIILSSYVSHNDAACLHAAAAAIGVCIFDILYCVNNFRRTYCRRTKNTRFNVKVDPFKRFHYNNDYLEKQ